MREHDTIALLSSMLIRSPAQLNRVFESDAEFVRLGGSTYGISIDEHNPTEDRFGAFHPETLGWNLVICTLSDLLAAGVRPAFYLHSMTLPRRAEENFHAALFRGVAAALRAEDCALLGGDTSFDTDWRYVGVALGPTERAISRTGLIPGDVLYSTGQFGSGNRQALLSFLLEQGRIVDSPELRQLGSVRFACRRNEAERAWAWVRAGIDTSDGLCGALRDLLRVNPGRGVLVEYDSTLLDESSAAVMHRFALPAELLLFGTEGEYELLFGVASEQVEAFVSAIGGAGCVPVRVGQVIEQPGLWFQAKGQRAQFDCDGLPDPRELEPSEYLACLTRCVSGFWRTLGEPS